MISKIKNIFKSEYGFTGQDLLVAMFILILFLGLLTGVYVNLSNTSYEIKLTARATEIITDFIEYVDELYYNQVDEEGNIEIDEWAYIDDFNAVNDQYPDSVPNNRIRNEFKDIDEGFILSYIITADDNNKKEIKVRVEFDWKNDTHVIENSFVKERELVKPQNSPDLSNVNYQPVKCVYNDSISDWEFVRTSNNDSNWYNYENHRWAVAVDSNATFDNDVLTNCSHVYVWIPRYCIDSNGNTHFLYKSLDDVDSDEENIDMVIVKDDNNDGSYIPKGVIFELSGSNYVDGMGNSLRLYYTNEDIEGYNTGYWVEVVKNNSNNIVLKDDSNIKINNLFENLSDSTNNYNCLNTRIPSVSGN